MPFRLFRPDRTPCDASAARSAHRSLCFERLETRALLAGNGLDGQYFHNIDFTGLAAERTEAVNFAWGTAAPAPGVRPESYSVRWTGQVEAAFSETYTFRTTSDDGVRLWVDGQLLVDNWTSHSAQVNTGSIALQAGKRYDVRLEYFYSAGSAQIQLQWSSPSLPLQVIPATQLYSSPSGLRGEYTDDADHVATRVDSSLDFDWGLFSPALGVSSDNFRASWSGMVRADFSEVYTFSTLSDEGVRVWIGDELIIDHWDPHAASTATGVETLEAGKWYDVRVEYFEGTGNATMKLASSSARQTGTGQFETIGAEHLCAAKATPLTFVNPLGGGADPFVVQWQNSYLLVRSAGGSVWINQSPELQDIHASTPESTTTRVWTPPAGMPYSTQIWAPELHQINGKWYIYVAASANGDNATHRMYVLERNRANPVGAYTFKGQLAATTDRWAIDGTVLQWQNQLYFVWSGWPGTTNTQQNLYIAAMSNPWTIAGERTLLSSPTYSWERHGLPINEGPEILIHDGKLHIIYSASGYWRSEYALGRLTYDGTGDLTDAASWSKSATPVFQQSGPVVGVGHASFTKSPDGTQDWIVYHAHHDAVVWNDDRDVRIQQFTYAADGTPDFGTPLPNSVVLQAPSGFADANRTPFAGDYDGSGAVNRLDLDVWKGQYGLTIFPGASADGVADGVIDGADFLAWQRRIGTTSTATAAAASSIDERVLETQQSYDEAFASTDFEPATSFAVNADEDGFDSDAATSLAIAAVIEAPPVAMPSTGVNASSPPQLRDLAVAGVPRATLNREIALLRIEEAQSALGRSERRPLATSSKSEHGKLGKSHRSELAADLVAPSLPIDGLH